MIGSWGGLRMGERNGCFIMKRGFVKMSLFCLPETGSE